MNNFIYYVPAVQDPGAVTGMTLAGIAKILALIGMMFAVLNAPAGISQLIGADLSVSSALQSLQTTLIGSSLLGSAGRMAVNTAKDAGAIVTYGAGRMIGGSSITQQIASLTGGSDGVHNPFVSNRPTLGGIEKGLDSLNSSDHVSLGSLTSDVITGGLPNLARPVSEINRSSGSFNNILSSNDYSTMEKIGRAGLRLGGMGATKMYSAASNRIMMMGSRGRVSQMPSLNRMSMISPVISNNVGGSDQ